MSAVATAIAGSAVLGAVVSTQASKRAADAQENATDKAASTELEMFDRNAALQEPWRQAGIGALGDLTKGTQAGGDYMRDFAMSDFQRDPGYQFRMDEGMRGIEASAAARGGVLSGGNLKDLTRFGQDFASGEYSNAYNRFNADRDRRFGRLSQLAGIGQTATGQITSQGAQTAQNIGDYQTQAGNARASGYVGQANAINQGLGTIGNYFGSQAQQQPYMGGQQWYGSGQPAGAAGRASWGSPGMNDFFYGSGTGGD